MVLPGDDSDKKCREWLDKAIDLIMPGATTDKGHTVISLFPAEELPIANRY